MPAPPTAGAAGTAPAFRAGRTRTTGTSTHVRQDLVAHQGVLRQALRAPATGARPLRARSQVRISRAARNRALDLAAARVPRLRPQGPLALAAYAAPRADPRLPANAGGDRRRDAHHHARGRARLSRAAAAAEPAGQSLRLLELVRSDDGARLGRGGDRGGAGARRAPPVPGRPQAGVRRRD